VLPIPSALRTEFEAYLRSRGAPNAEQGAYGKWLRFYLDFCRKYHFPEELRGSLTPFLGKLEEKKQTKAQQLQASQAITLYFDLLQSKDAQSDGRSPRMVSPRGEISDESSYRPILSVHEVNTPQTSLNPPAKIYEREDIHFEPISEPVSFSGTMSTATGASWRGVFTRLAEEIQLRAQFCESSITGQLRHPDHSGATGA